MTSIYKLNIHVTGIVKDVSGREHEVTVRYDKRKIRMSLVGHKDKIYRNAPRAMQDPGRYNPTNLWPMFETISRDKLLSALFRKHIRVQAVLKSKEAQGSEEKERRLAEALA